MMVVIKSSMKMGF